jgi:hypothetical protein
MHAIQQHATAPVAQWTRANPTTTASNATVVDAAEGPAYLLHRDERARIEFLETAEDRRLIAGLRRHAPMGLEEDLGAQLLPYEAERDELGAVTAMFLGDRLVGTLRFVPSGHNLTSAERIADRVPFDRAILGTGNWEVGRLIIAPEFRHPELLARCLTLALEELIVRETVHHFYAVCTPPVARLWRRFGMDRIAKPYGGSGKQYALVAGRVENVATALGVPLSPADVLSVPAYLPPQRPATVAPRYS